MSRNRIVGGRYTKISHRGHSMFSKTNITTSAGKSVTETGAKEGVTYNAPKAPPSVGALDLINIVINVTYDVCHDQVKDFSDYKNFWILEDKGKYYHWLNPAFFLAIKSKEILTPKISMSKIL